MYGINYFGRGHLATDGYINYIKYDTVGKDLLNSSLTYVPYLRDEYKNLTNFREYGSIKNTWVQASESIEPERITEIPWKIISKCSIYVGGF